MAPFPEDLRFFSSTHIGAHNCPVPEANTLSWSLQALHTCDTQTYRQIKIFMYIKQKQKFSVQITQMFSNSVVAHACDLDAEPVLHLWHFHTYFTVVFFWWGRSQAVHKLRMPMPFVHHFYQFWVISCSLQYFYVIMFYVYLLSTAKHKCVLIQFKLLSF